MDGIKTFLKGSKVKVIITNSKEDIDYLVDNPSQFQNVESETQFYHGQTINLFLILVSQETCRSWRNSLTSNLEEADSDSNTKRIEEAPYSIRHKFEQLHFYLEAHPKETKFNEYNQFQSLSSSHSATSSALTHWTLNQELTNEAPYFNLLTDTNEPKIVPLYNGCIHIVNPNYNENKPKLFRHLGSWCAIYKVKLKVTSCNLKFFNLGMELCILCGVPNNNNVVKRKQFRWQLPNNFLLNDSSNNNNSNGRLKLPNLLVTDTSTTNSANTTLSNDSSQFEDYYEDGISFNNNVNNNTINNGTNSNPVLKSWLLPGRIYKHPIKISPKLEVKLDSLTYLRSLNKLVINLSLGNRSFFKSNFVKLKVTKFNPSFDNSKLQLISIDSKFTADVELDFNECFNYSYFLDLNDEAIKVDSFTFSLNVHLQFLEKDCHPSSFNSHLSTHTFNEKIFDVSYKLPIDLAKHLPPQHPLINNLNNRLLNSSGGGNFKPYHNQSFSSMTSTSTTNTITTTTTNRSNLLESSSLYQHLLSPKFNELYDSLTFKEGGDDVVGGNKLRVSAELRSPVKVGIPFNLKVRIVNFYRKSLNLYLFLDFNFKFNNFNFPNNGFNYLPNPPSLDLLMHMDSSILKGLDSSFNSNGSGYSEKMDLFSEKSGYYVGKLDPNRNLELDFKLTALTTSCTKIPRLFIVDTTTMTTTYLDPKLVIMAS